MTQSTQSNESRSLIAIFLCIAFYLGYQKYISWKYPDLQKPRISQSPSPSTGESETTTVTPSAAPTGASPGTPSLHPPISQLSQDQLTFETDKSIWTFSQETGALSRVILKEYRSEKSKDSPAVNILDTPMNFQGILSQSKEPLAKGPFNAERSDRTLKMWRMVDQIKVTQEFTIPPQGYLGNLKITFTNLGEPSREVTGGLYTQEMLTAKSSTPIMGFIPGVVTEQDQIVTYVDGKGQWNPLKDFCSPDHKPLSGTQAGLEYLGIDRHYFLALIQPKAKTSSFFAEHIQSSPAGCTIGLGITYALGQLAANQSLSLDFDLYFGPKDLSILGASNSQLAGAMHLGFFDFIARPLMLVIDGFYKVLNNYGLAIIFLTILLKILFYPLVRASQVSMHQMKKLNPQMAAIREKWKDDKARQQKELMSFMAQHKINPMKGCLPILPQIPVFFAFYQVLQTSINLRHAPFFGWIQDLSAMDPYLVTPLLMGVAMFFQQKLTPTTGMDKTQEKILLFMPIIFTAMMLTLPAGLTLYMLTNTVVGIGQQQWLMKRLDLKQTNPA